MRSSLWFFVALALGIALGLSEFQRHQAAHAPVPPPPPPLVHTQMVRAPANFSRNNVNLNLQSFSWKTIESDDYVQYIKNLRSIGCPEPTIRDLIIADVNHIYARKRHDSLAARKDEWWRSEPDMDLQEKAIRTLEALDKERRTLLAQLLGPNWESGDEIAAARANLGLSFNGPILQQLSPETMENIRTAFAKFESAYAAHRAERQSAGQFEDPLAVAKIQMEYRAALEKALTPEQLEEFLVRNSKLSDQMRKELEGFNTTRDEFLAIFRARDAADRQLIFGGFTTLDAMNRQADAALEQADNTIKQALGGDRYRQYKFNVDPIYRDARSLAEETGADPQTVPGIYQVQKAVAAETQTIRNNPQLTPDQRLAAMQSMREQAEAALRQILGDAAYAKYARSRMDATQTPPPPAPVPQ